MISVHSLAKTYRDSDGDIRAVRGVTFEVPSGTFFTLLGPSGCGKTTTLRCIAGLERPEAGDIQIGERLVFSSGKRVVVPANQRRIGMVFQSYAVWPHLDVFENVAFPLKIRRVSGSEVRSRVGRTLELVGLGGLERRPVVKLSGGQQQRVAVARALVGEPEVLLFDEPLSNLDAKLREEMRHELREIQQRLAITTVYVTHDQQEALMLSDLVGVMVGGELVEVGAPEDIYNRPQREVTAKFVGLANRLECRVAGVADGLTVLDSPLGKLTCSSELGRQVGEQVIAFIRPEKVDIAERFDSGDRNVVAGRVVSVAFLGELIDCTIAVGETQLRCRLASGAKVRSGDPCVLRIHPDHVVPLPAGNSTSP